MLLEYKVLRYKRVGAFLEHKDASLLASICKDGLTHVRRIN